MSSSGRIARGGAINLAGSVVSAVAAFLLVVLVANYTSENSAGMLFAAVSVLTIATAICTLGTDTGLARFALRYESQGRYGDVTAAIRVAATPVAICVVVLSSTMFASAEVLAPVLGLGDEGGATMLRLTALVLPFATANDLALAATRAFGKMRPTVAVDSFLRSLLQVGGVIAAGSIGATAAGLAGAWMLPYVATRPPCPGRSGALDPQTSERLARTRRRRQGRGSARVLDVHLAEGRCHGCARSPSNAPTSSLSQR